jgi:molybdopterin molybdotransferase
MTMFKTQSDYPMIPFEDAMRILAERIRPLAAQPMALDAVAVGTVLAQDVRASEAVPAFDAATMDGYAVIAQDRDARRHVLGESEAGRPAAQRVSPGECVRIMTGAPLPDGADAVIPVEYTQEALGWMTASLAARPGLNVRPAGSDVATDQLVLPAGSVLGPAEIGLLAALGEFWPCIYPAPRVAVLATGDELAAQGESLKPGQIRDSNSYILAAAIRSIGCHVTRVSRIADSHMALRSAIQDAVSSTDIVLTTGGVSMGTRDLVKPVLEELGTVHFGRVAVKPGLPLTFATVEEVPVIGLPGNPVSTLVGFEVEVRPVLRAMGHRTARWRPEREVLLEHAVRHDADRLEFQRATVQVRDGDWWARTTGSQVSSRLLSLVGANALLRIPRGTGDLPAGALVMAILIDEPETDVAP